MRTCIAVMVVALFGGFAPVAHGQQAAAPAATVPKTSKAHCDGCDQRQTGARAHRDEQTTNGAVAREDGGRCTGCSPEKKHKSSTKTAVETNSNGRCRGCKTQKQAPQAQAALDGSRCKGCATAGGAEPSKTVEVTLKH